MDMSLLPNRLRFVISAVAAALVLLAVFVAPHAEAQGTIYRCHALNGDLLFQDKPCNAAGATREAKANSEGEVVATAPATQQEGTSAAERYSRYLDFVSKDRREQASVDEAEASRLRARAEADRATAAASNAGSVPSSDCALFGPNGECVSSSSNYYDSPYGPAYGYVPQQPRHPIYNGPYRPPVAPNAPVASGGGPRPLGPNQPPRGLSSNNARNEVLSLSP